MMTKKKFKELCYHTVYTSTGKRINAFFYDYQSYGGYKYMIWCTTKSLSKKELFDEFYDWVIKGDNPLWYASCKVAETDEKRFKVPLSIKG